MNEIEQFNKILSEIAELKEKKSADYKSTWRVFGIQGLYAEIGKKFARIWVNKNKKENLNYESLRDTLIDLVVYCVMTIQLLDDKDTEDKVEKLLNQ